MRRICLVCQRRRSRAVHVQSFTLHGVYEHTIAGVVDRDPISTIVPTVELVARISTRLRFLASRDHADIPRARRGNRASRLRLEGDRSLILGSHSREGYIPCVVRTYRNGDESRPVVREGYISVCSRQIQEIVIATQGCDPHCEFLHLFTVGIGRLREYELIYAA